jgi:hypothetical protein
MAAQPTNKVESKAQFKNATHARHARCDVGYVCMLESIAAMVMGLVCAVRTLSVTN